MRQGVDETALPQVDDGVWSLADEPQAPAAPANRIKGAPKLMSVYWCDFWTDARRPEFYKTRPVLVVSLDNRLDGVVTVLPITSKPQGGNKWAHKLPRNPNPNPSAPRRVWVVCNHPYTVSCSRLSQFRGQILRLTAEEFAPVLDLLLSWLPKPLARLQKPSQPARVTSVTAERTVIATEDAVLIEEAVMVTKRDDIS